MELASDRGGKLLRTVVISVVLGVGWLCGSSGWAASESGIRTSNEVQAAHKLYVTKCAKCHKLYPPAKYSDKDWQKWMDKMSRKSKLRPEEKEMLERYIEETLRHPAPERTAAKQP